MRHDSPPAAAAALSRLFAAIYHRCHPIYSVALSHQAVRVLQLVSEEDRVSVQRVAAFLACAPNAASELVSRLVAKGLVEKRRDAEDERVVHLSLTELGRKALAEHVGLDVPKLAVVLEKTDAATQRELVAAFERLLELLAPDRA